MPGHADWQEIARHPARHPKNRYELRRRDKIVSRSAVHIAPYLSLSRDRRYCADPTRRQLFLAGYGECARAWRNPAYRYDRVVIPQIAFSAVEEEKRTRAARLASLDDINLG